MESDAQIKPSAALYNAFDTLEKAVKFMAEARGVANEHTAAAINLLICQVTKTKQNTMFLIDVLHSTEMDRRR